MTNLFPQVISDVSVCVHLLPHITSLAKPKLFSWIFMNMAFDRLQYFTVDIAASKRPMNTFTPKWCFFFFFIDTKHIWTFVSKVPVIQKCHVGESLSQNTNIANSVEKDNVICSILLIHINECYVSVMLVLIKKGNDSSVLLYCIDTG